MAWFDTLASVVLLGLGLLHLVRLTTAGRDRRSRAGEVSHAAMGFGMAVMFWPAIDPLPLPVWLVLFGLAAAWFTASAIRDGLAVDNAGHHIVCSLAMLFMLFLGPHHSMEVAGGEHAAHAGPHTSAATSSLWTSLAALVLVGYFAWHGMRCGGRWSATRLDRTGSPRLTGIGVTGGEDVAVREADCVQGRPVNGGSLSALWTTPRTAAIAHLLTSASMATMLLGAI